MPTTTSRSLAALLLLAVVASDLDAQVRRGRENTDAVRWAPVAVGVHGGYDQRANAEVLRAAVRIPVVRSGVVELVPGADVAFLRTSKDYQYGAELAWVPGGTRGGVIVAAGVAWRDTPIEATSPGGRNTFFGYVLGGGAKSPVGPLELEVGVRWVFLNDTDYRPNMATIGVNLPLWSVQPAR